MSCFNVHDPQLVRLTTAIAQRVGPQLFNFWFDNSTKLDLKQDELEIAVPNDFISEWIDRKFAQPIQEAAREVLGCSLNLHFSVVPQLFEAPKDGESKSPPQQDALLGRSMAIAPAQSSRQAPSTSSSRQASEAAASRSFAGPRPKLRHDLGTFVVGPSNQFAYNCAIYVAQFPGAQYNPLFIHGGCGLGKTHLLQGLCREFQKFHPTKRWTYMTGEDFTNDFLTALRGGKVEAFRRRMRDLDLLVIDDVHFIAGKKATQEEFLHTFNAIEASGRQVVMASDAHPKMIEEFGESLINRFVSGMVVRIDPPNFNMRCEILRGLSARTGFVLPEDVSGWIARRVTQNVRELEGAITRMSAYVRHSGREPDVQLAQEALGDLDRHSTAPVKPDAILGAVCDYFGVENKDLMSGRRQRTVSLARSVAMFLVRKTARLSYPEIGQRLGKRNHSTVISACRRIERAISRNDELMWNSAVGERREEAGELLQRLEEHSRAVN